MQGSTVTLEVDGVQVGVATLPAAANQARQVGLFLVSTTQVEVSGLFRRDRTAEGFHRDAVLIAVQRSLLARHQGRLRPRRIQSRSSACRRHLRSRHHHQGRHRSNCKVSSRHRRYLTRQPERIFRSGIRVGLGKSIILLAQRRKPGEPLPFDLSAFRVLFYDDTIGGKPKLEEGLVNHLREILGK